MRVIENSLEFKEFLIGMEVGQEIEYHGYSFLRVLGGFIVRYNVRFALCFIPYQPKIEDQLNRIIDSDLPELEVIKSPKKRGRKKKNV